MTVLRGISVVLLFLSIMINAYIMTRIRDGKSSKYWRIGVAILLAVAVILFAISYFFNI
ncbi:MAG: hypothetical protein LUD79_00420 [Oscillospiraceae bacterium]|nr:hypothetical protein [Oscillospiraceae bacterium]